MLTQEECIIRDYLKGSRSKFGRDAQLEGKNGLFTYGREHGFHPKIMVTFVFAWSKHGYIEVTNSDPAFRLTDKGREFIARA